MSLLHKKRFFAICFLVSGLSLTVGLVLHALSNNINLFYTPTQLTKEEISPNRTIRLGGMVVKNSVVRGEALWVEFTLTDFHSDTLVRYQGILPDLFREGQGIVATGHLNGEGIFLAKQVLAKHDEKYMPPEVAKTLNERYR